MDRTKNLIPKLKRKIRGSEASSYWEHNKGYEFKPAVFEQEKPVYLQGCWLSEKYFSDIKTRVREAFIFGKPGKINAKALENIAAQPNSVSIHIRKGDYQASNIHINVDYAVYLEEAMAYFTNNDAEAVYYVFSDDMIAAKEILETYRNEKQIHFVDWNKGEDSFWDMFLMSKCQHNIITNSTFSWWAAWLNDNSDKIIISPKDWFTVKEWNKNSIVPPGWITV